MSDLVLLAGIPGSGKTTWATTLFDGKYAVISSDRIRKELAGSLRGAHEQKVNPWDEFYSQIELRLQHDVDVMADATFLTRKHRTRAREVAERTHSTLHLVLFKNWVQGMERNHQREEDAQVPDHVMKDMVDLLWDTVADLPNEEYATVTQIEALN